MPGEIEFRKLKENMKTGLGFSEALEKELVELSVALGVVPDGSSFEGLVNCFN